MKSLIIALCVFCSVSSIAETFLMGGASSYFGPLPAGFYRFEIYSGAGTTEPYFVSEGNYADGLKTISKAIDGEWYRIKFEIDGYTLTANETYKFYVNGAIDPTIPTSEIYSFDDVMNFYDQVIPAVVSLQYKDPDTGEWVTVAGQYLTGKDSVLDDPIPYQFGSYDLPAGIVEWQQGYTYGLNTELEALRTSELENEYGTMYLEVSEEGSVSSGGIDLVDNITSPSVSVPHTSTVGVNDVMTDVQLQNATGIANAPVSTNSAVNDAVAIAAGMDMSGIGDSLEDVETAVSGLGEKLDGIHGAIEAGSGGVVDVVDSGQEFSTGAVIPADYTESTTIDEISGRVGGMISKIETLIDLAHPIFPDGITDVSSMSITTGLGYTATVTFPEFTLARTITEWGLHAIFFVTVILMLRSGVA